MSMVLTILTIGVLAQQPPAVADVRITNSHLVATCVAGRVAADGERAWRLSQPTTMAFTMKNEPRPGIENHAPGIALIEFTPEAGHKYEIEVQTVASANSLRVWPRGKWAPAVRDRTTDRVVSGEPKWIEKSCN
jgi:hypothetical protein